MNRRATRFLATATIAVYGCSGDEAGEVPDVVAEDGGQDASAGDASDTENFDASDILTEDAATDVDVASDATADPEADAASDPDGTLDTDTDTADGSDVELDAETTDPDAEPDADAPDPPTLTVAEYCTLATEAAYDWQAFCFGEDAYAPEDRPAFVEFFGGRCMLAGAAVEAGRLGYEAERAAACIENLNRDFCGARITEVEACQNVFSSSVSDGGECYAFEGRYYLVGTDQCIGGYCDEAGECPGVCEPFPARGALCPDGRCAPDDYCDEDGRCVAAPGPGEPCPRFVCAVGLRCFESPDGPTCGLEAGRDDTCDDTLPCRSPTICIDGRCSVDSVVGGPCVSDHSCPDGFICLAGEDGGPLSCQPQLSDGSECEYDGQCVPGSGCMPPRAGEAGPQTCRTLPGDGASCDVGRCADRLRCEDLTPETLGTCRPLGAVGDECEPFIRLGLPDCEPGLFCMNDARCAPQGELDEPCAVFRQETCVEGLWCARATGLCTEPAAVGGFCNPLWETTCSDGLVCQCGDDTFGECAATSVGPESDTCELPRELGDVCLRSDDCASRYCAGEEGDLRCAGRPPSGPCLPADD